jgi:hypothetical protein
VTTEEFTLVPYGPPEVVPRYMLYPATFEEVLAVQLNATEWDTTVGVRLIVVVLLSPFRLAVMVAVWLALTVPAVATNVPLLAPLIVTLAGTLSVLTLLDRLIVKALVAALVSVTVHVDVCALASVVGEQLTVETCAGAVRPKENVCEVPLALAVSTAVWSAVIVPAVAVNVNVVAPEAAVTLAGTVALALLLDSAMARPPLGAAPLSVPVQAEVPGAFTLDGVQESPVGATAGMSTTHAPPGRLAVTTRWTVAFVHTPAPVMFAVQGDRPSVIFTARLTSKILTTPSAFKSQAFNAPPLDAALKETVLLA